MLAAAHDTKDIQGLLRSGYPTLTEAQYLLLDVADRYELQVMAPPIPRTVRFAEASASGCSVLAARKNKGSCVISRRCGRASFMRYCFQRIYGYQTNSKPLF